MKIITALVLSTVSLFALADNQQGFYVGGGAGMIQFSDGSAFDEDNSGARFRAVELLGGYKYNSALGLEVRVGTGFGDRDVTIQDGTASVSGELAVDRYESLYYRPELANKEAKLYGLLGYSQVKRSASGAVADVAGGSDTESGVTYGVGVGFVINPKSNLNFEYRRLIDKDSYEIEAATINVDYRL